eukprot:6050004-Prymnesium_polylepis.2
MAESPARLALYLALLAPLNLAIMPLVALWPPLQPVFARHLGRAYLLDVPCVTFSCACAFGFLLAIAVWFSSEDAVKNNTEQIKGGWTAKNVFFLIWSNCVRAR